MLNTGYKCASGDIVFEEFEGELVVLNLASGRYFGFNQSAAKIWAALMSGVHPIKLTTSNFSEGTLTEFVKRLTKLELIVIDPDVDAALSDEIMSELVKNGSKPTVEVYEDLADLIVADPIHDVDHEKGWPIKADAS